MTHSENTFDTIFDHARRLSDLQKRETYLKRVCGHDPALRAEIESLLAADAQADGFMKTQLDSRQDSSSISPYEGAGTLIGPYKLLEKIGEGGFGVVYMAEQKEPIRRRVALKIIKLGMDTAQVVARFEAERQALALMDHPNIAKVMAGGATDSGRPYFVMELVRGTPITAYCDVNHLSTEERLELFISVCRAIQHAHQKGVIHRDIKPSNVLVAMHDDKPVVRIIDFGIAKAMHQSLTEKTLFTQFQQFIGTPTYMSPEQAGLSSLDIDTRSDIYSLGVLLYEILTGQPPLDPKELTTGDYAEMRRRIQEVEAPKPSTRFSMMSQQDVTTVATQRKSDPVRLKRLLKGDLDWIILKALEKDRKRRYDTANAFAEDIRRFLNHRPVTAAAPSTIYVLKKYARRHRASIAVTVGFVLLLVVGTTVSVTQAIRANRGETRANTLYNEAETLRLQERAAKERAQRNAYIAGITLVQADWEKGNYQRVRETLASLADYPDRSFEWFYWQHMAHLDTISVPTFSGGIRSFALSPDGHRMASVMKDHSIEVRSTTTGEKLSTFTGHVIRANAAAFSPDGRMVASCGGAYGEVRLWDPDTGEQIAVFGSASRPIGNSLTSLDFSQDGKFIVTGGGYANDVYRLDIKTGRALRLGGSAPNRWISKVAYAHNDTWIFAKGSVLGKYDVHTGRRVAQIGDADNEFQVSTFACSPTSPHLALVRGQIEIHDTETADFSEPLHTIEVDLPGRTRLSFSPDGARLLVSIRGDTHIYDTHTWTLQQTLPGGSYLAQQVPHSQRVISTDGHKTVKLWDTSTIHHATPKKLDYQPVEISEDGRRMLVLSPADAMGSAREARITDTDTGLLSPMRLAIGKDIKDIHGFALSEDGRWVAIGVNTKHPHWDDCRLKVFDAMTGELKLSLHTPRAEHQAVSFGPQGKTVAARERRGGGIGIWEIETGRKRFSQRDDFRINVFAFSPDGAYLAGGSPDGVVKIWNTRTGKGLIEWQAHEIQRFNAFHVFDNHCMAYSPDGRCLATGGLDGLVKIWDAKTGQLQSTLSGHRGEVKGIGFTPDGKRVFSYAGDGSVRFWDSATGRQVLELQDPLFDDTHKWTVAFSRDGTRVIAMTPELPQYRIWEAASDAQVTEWLAQERTAAARWSDAQAQVLKRTKAAWNESQRLSALYRPGVDARKARHKQARQLSTEDARAIKQWLVLSPIPYNSVDGLLVLDDELIPNEAEVRPRENQSVTINGNAHEWMAYHLEDFVLDLHYLDEKPEKATYYCAGYAVTYLICDTERENLMIKVGSADQAKITLNGQEVYRKTDTPQWEPDRDTVTGIRLKAGVNLLVFKLVSQANEWKGSLRIMQADGQPVPGLRISLDPDTHEFAGSIPEN
jgi:eukaryotic-like serine/threonine-protein kinase